MGQITFKNGTLRFGNGTLALKRVIVLYKEITGYNSDESYGGRTPGTWTPSTAITITAGEITGWRNSSSWGVGYIIEKNGTTVMSGTGTSVMLSASERTALSGLGVISVDCSSPIGTVSYGFRAVLTISYTE